MTDERYDELLELMGEPPGGHGHGRERFQGAGWHPLETDPNDDKSYKEHVVPRQHGTRAVYQDGCKCDKCRAWNSERVRRQRAGNVPT